MAATMMRSRWNVVAAVLATIFVGLLCCCGKIASRSQILTPSASLLTDNAQQQQLQQYPLPSWLKGERNGDHTPRSLQDDDDDDEAQGDLFWTNTYCPNSNNNQYQTVRVWWLFAWFYEIFNQPRDGACGRLCRDELCRHKPCVPDFEAPDEELCFCFPNKVDSLCGQNAECMEDDNDFQDVGTCKCREGYVLSTNPNGGCTDIDECTLGDVCGPNGKCENLVGSFRCNCNAGYFWDSPRGGCKDRNECELDTAPCGPNARCTNTLGSFTCVCDNGFAGNPPNGDNCRDIDECVPNNPCGANSVKCNNEVPGYSCDCNSGYEDQNGFCRDIQECTTNRDNCDDVSEICINEVPGFRCDCNAGYRDTGGTPKCTNINECTETPNICGTNGDCTDSPGSFTCTCKVGFPGGSPPNCRKLNEYEACPSGFDNDCQPGLVCGTTSFSDLETTTCCSSTEQCNVSQECCVGVYVGGEECPSGLPSDCRGSLQCAWRNLVDATLVCCQNTLPVPLSSARFCI